MIPKFKNYKDEAEFWDTHDITDFLPEMKKIKVEYKPRVFKEESIVVRVQPKLKKRLEVMAENQGLNLSTMLRMWFVERLRKI